MVDGFRLYCLAEGKATTTIRWYLGELAILEHYLKANGLPTTAEAISLNHLRAFLVHLRQEVRADENNPMKPTREVSLAGNTIQGNARTLKAFFSWMYREGYIAQDPARLLKVPKVPKVLIETFCQLPSKPASRRHFVPG
jgi:site-specific recombinase XerD